MMASPSQGPGGGPTQALTNPAKPVESGPALGSSSNLTPSAKKRTPKRDPLLASADGASGSDQRTGTSSGGGDSAAVTAAKQYHPRRIWMYRNNDQHFLGKRILVNQRRFKNFEQFLASLTTDIGLRSGAVRKVFTVKGAKVESLGDLTDNGVYVAVGNEPFRLVEYAAPPPLQPLVSARARGLDDPAAQDRIVEQRRSRSRSRARSSGMDQDLMGPLEGSGGRPGAAGQEKPIFSPDSKGYRVAVFRNGDALTPPTRMVLSNRNCHTFDQLMNEMTATMKLKEGRVRRLFDADSLRTIKTLHDLRDGQNLIASGTNHPAPAALNYPKIDFTQATDFRRITLLENDRGKVITVFPNGDAMHTGFKVTVTNYRFKDLDKLLTYLNNEVPLYTGKATHMCQLDGTKVHDMSALVGNGSYVLVSGTDPFRHVMYNADGYRKAPQVGATNQSMSRANEVLERSKRLLEAKSGGGGANGAEAQQGGAPAPAVAAGQTQQQKQQKPPKKQPQGTALGGTNTTVTVGNVTVTANIKPNGSLRADVRLDSVPEDGNAKARAVSPLPQAFDSTGQTKDLSLKRRPTEDVPSDPSRCPESAGGGV